MLFKDLGTETDYTDWSSDTNFTISRDDVETTLIQTSTSSMASHYLTISDYTVPITIEFDFCLNFTGNGGTGVMSIRQSSTSKASITPNALGLVSGEYSHVKLILTDEEVQITVDGTSKTSIPYDATFNRFYITQNANVAWQSIKYKNFILY